MAEKLFSGSLTTFSGVLQASDGELVGHGAFLSTRNQGRLIQRELFVDFWMERYHKWECDSHFMKLISVDYKYMKIEH